MSSILVYTDFLTMPVTLISVIVPSLSEFGIVPFWKELRERLMLIVF